MIVIDCSRQNEILKGAAEIRLEFGTLQNIPDDTTAFCLIILDCLVKYNLLPNSIKEF